jgi:vacuolar-type H+-ATPase subunit I/STV1
MNAYYSLLDQARQKWMQAQELIDRIEYLYTHNRIDGDEKYEMFSKVESLQNQATKLESEASEAMINMWFEQYKDDMDRTEQMKEETELRGQL